MDKRSFSLFFAITLVTNGFCFPSHHRLRRQTSTLLETTVNPPTTAKEVSDEIKVKDDKVPSKNEATASVPIDPSDDYVDDDLSAAPAAPASSTGGSSIFSLLNILGAVLPSSSSSSILQNILNNMIVRLKPNIRRQLTNEIDFEPLRFQRQDMSDSGSGEDSSSDDDEANPNQELDSEMDTNEDDYDEPEGDGQGGGILGILAGLNGGEDGQSDLGSLLATVSGIVANLSGDGIDLNALIASGIGLFVGLLSEGNENPGSVIASYFLTSLDTITGGGSTNNGAFFGNLLSKLVQGASAAIDPDASSEENGGQPDMKDSAGFFSSLHMAILGNMSKSSSSGSSHP